MTSHPTKPVSLHATVWVAALLGGGLLVLSLAPAPQSLGALLGLLAPWTLATVLESRLSKARTSVTVAASSDAHRATVQALPDAPMEKPSTVQAPEGRPSMPARAPASRPCWRPAYGSSPPGA